MTLRFDLVADAEQEGGPEGRQEGEAVVGMGHAHRCLALGEALQKKGGSPRLFLPDPSLGEKMFPRIKEANASRLIFWGARCGSWQELWEDLKEGAEKGVGQGVGQAEARKPREMLVVDSYRLLSLPAGVSARYKEIACFHDDKPPPAFARVAICCDLSTKNFVRSSSCDRSFRGGQYFPFHDRFARNATTGKIGKTGKKGKKGDDRLLVWFGGRERGENLMPLLAKDVLGGWRAEVVISPMVAPCAELMAVARKSEGRVRVHHEAGAMEALLARCAVYFGGAGVAACEAALLGLNLILCPVASNQHGNARAFEEAGAKVLRPPLLPEAVQHALQAIERGLQPALALDALGLDGRGAERLAQALCERVAS